MKFPVNGVEVFASTGGRPFAKKKPLIILVHGCGLTHMTWYSKLGILLFMVIVFSFRYALDMVFQEVKV